MNVRERLGICGEILGQIDRQREKAGDPGVGRSIELRIIDRELRDLEKQILADPGALESQLVRVRPRRRRV